MVRGRANEETGQAPSRHRHWQTLNEVWQTEHYPVLQQFHLSAGARPLADLRWITLIYFLVLTLSVKSI